MRRWWLAIAAAIASAQPLPLTGITHVALRVDDLARSRGFYSGVLGFDEPFQFTDQGRTTVAFIRINERQYVELYPGVQPAGSTRLMHVCFETPDIAAVRRLLLARGFAPSAVSKGRAGNLLCAVKDPDAQTVEFLQYLPGSLHSRADAQSLGVRRLSGRLLRVAVPVKNLDAASAFYRDRLGFREIAPGVPVLRVPGARGDLIELVRGGAPRLGFEAGSWRDPDGTAVDLMPPTAPRAPSARPDTP